MKRSTASEFDQEILGLYDDYAHGRINRRGFLERASRFVADGLTAAAILESLSPNYAFAQQVAKDDKRVEASYEEYPSPKGAGKMHGYLVKPAGAEKKTPAVLVVHENRGLNPYIEDVAGAWRPTDSLRSRPMRCFRSEAIPATTTRVATCRQNGMEMR